MTSRRPSLASTFLFLLSTLLAACGSSSGTAPPVGNSSGLPRSSTIASLTTAQAGTLCDWANAKEGGYGRSMTCPDGSDGSTDPSRESCVSLVVYLGIKCPTLSVGDLEDCGNASGADVCSIPAQAACAAFNACVGA